MSEEPQVYVSRLHGTSMRPIIESGDRIVWKGKPFDNIRKGDVVLYRTRKGDVVAHLADEKTNAGWKVKGVNNRHRDEGFVGEGNYMGVGLYRINNRHEVIHFNEGISHGNQAKPTE